MRPLSRALERLQPPSRGRRRRRDSDTAGSSSSAPEVSIEDRVRERSWINVGDTMRFDVLGQQITARVTSVRRVDWRDGRRGGFMSVFRPDPFDAAPVMFIAAVRAPSQPTSRALVAPPLTGRELQQRLAGLFLDRLRDPDGSAE